MKFLETYFSETKNIASQISLLDIQKIINGLVQLRSRGGRLFFLGVGGSAANASHAVNDFRKLCEIESYCVSDNVSELTARVNDDGWDTSFSNWLLASKINSNDAIFVLSVGGGNREKGVSTNIVNAIDLAKSVNAGVFGVVGRDGGYTSAHGDAICVIPPLAQDRVTPHSEAFQAVVWHAIVSHPDLARNSTKW
tara:strand:+ start:639 stop:1223 length:585 start_codon:yes stop_codon:yes gene_type:complete